MTGRRAFHACCVVGGKNKSPETKFYRFPVQKHKLDQRQKWVTAVKRKNLDGTPWQPTQNSRICSNHFIGNKKSEHPLSPSFIPTIFPPEYYGNKQSERSKKSATERFKRNLERQNILIESSTTKRLRSEKVPLYDTVVNPQLNEPTIEDVEMNPCAISTCDDKGTQVDFSSESTDFKNVSRQKLWQRYYV